MGFIDMAMLNTYYDFAYYFQIRNALYYKTKSSTFLCSGRDVFVGDLISAGSEADNVTLGELLNIEDTQVEEFLSLKINIAGVSATIIFSKTNRLRRG